MSNNSNATSLKLRNLVTLASNAMPYAPHIPNGAAEPTAYIKQNTTKGVIFTLGDDSLPALMDRKGRIARAPRASLAGKTVRFDAAVMANSMVAQAGAAIIIMPDQAEPIPTGTDGLIVLHRKPANFAVVDPANMTTVGDDDDTPVSAIPIRRATISFDNSVTKAFRLELSRSDVREGGDREEFEAMLLASVVLGLARACDDVLLDAITASAPAAFSLASAAAQGVRFGDLRGFVGTGGAGASIGQDGVLRLAGVQAELTNTIAGSLVGAFEHAGVAVRPDLRMEVTRIDKAGTLSLQVFVDLVPLLPVPGRFWTVAP